MNRQSARLRASALLSSVLALSSFSTRAFADDAAAVVPAAPKVESNARSPMGGAGSVVFGEGYPSTGKYVFGSSMLAVSVGLLATGVGFHVAAFGKQSKLDDLKSQNGGSAETLCAASQERCADYLSSKRDLSSMGRTYVALYSASVFAFGTTFLVSNLLWRNATSPSAAASIRPAVGLGTVGVGGTF